MPTPTPTPTPTSTLTSVSRPTRHPGHILTPHSNPGHVPTPNSGHVPELSRRPTLNAAAGSVAAGARTTGKAAAVRRAVYEGFSLQGLGGDLSSRPGQGSLFKGCAGISLQGLCGGLSPGARR
eukprot:285859-Chlamydomonas_euryale.AAC.2